MVKKNDDLKIGSKQTIKCVSCGKDIVVSPCDNGKSIGGKCQCGLFNSKAK